MKMPVLLLLPLEAIFVAITLLGEVHDARVLTGGAIVIFGVGKVITEPSYLINWWCKVTG